MLDAQVIIHDMGEGYKSGGLFEPEPEPEPEMESLEYQVKLWMVSMLLIMIRDILT